MEHPLRAYRTRKTIGMESMAERLGVAVPQLSRIETGVRGVSPAMALKIHDVTQGEIAKWELRPDLWEAPAQTLKGAAA